MFESQVFHSSIVVGLDSTPASHRAPLGAGRQAQWDGVPLTVVHAVRRETGVSVDVEALDMRDALAAVTCGQLESVVVTLPVAEEAVIPLESALAAREEELSALDERSDSEPMHAHPDEGRPEIHPALELVPVRVRRERAGARTVAPFQAVQRPPARGRVDERKQVPR